VFKSKTPSFAHLVKFPVLGGSNPKSLLISLKILSKEGGFGIPS
jgi:hypothetical protein